MLASSLIASFCSNHKAKGWIHQMQGGLGVLEKNHENL